MKKEIEVIGGDKENFLPEECQEDICIIRCSNDKVINLPKKLLDEIGWEINKKVIWTVATLHSKGDIWKIFVEIETVDDCEKEYFSETEIKENVC